MSMNPGPITHERSALSRPVTLAIERVYWLFAILQSFGALVFLLQMKSEPDAALLLGLSPVRIAIGLGMLVTALAFVWLLVESWIIPSRYEQRIQRLASLLSRRKAWGLGILATGMLFLAGSYFIALVPEVTEPFTLAYFERLLPLVIWGTGLSAQTLIVLPILRYGAKVVNLRPKGKAFYLTILLAAGILLIWSWVVKAILPHEIHIGWNSLGAPILEFQILLGWAAGMLMLLFIVWATKNPNPSGLIKKLTPWRIDLLVCFLIWLGAVILWQSIPISPSWFISKPVAPNNEYYPTSDAQAYDISAQIALVGEGFKFQGTPYVRRSLHAFYLTLLHLLVGQNYEKVVFGQILVLALLPALIYLATKAIHNRISGTIAAVLILLREANSISLSTTITTSHTKLLMVDLPTALLVVGFTYFVILWLKQIEERALFALVAGGVLGLAMLVRLETFVLALPTVVVAALILFPKKRRLLWTKNMLLFLTGVLLVISPWIWRNWKMTGEVFIDSPVFRFALIYQRFHPLSTQPPESVDQPKEEPSESTPQTPSQATPTAGLPTLTVKPTQKSPSNVGGKVTNYAKNAAPELILQNSNQVARFIIAHDLNSEIQTILYLPTTFRILDSFMGFIGHRSTKMLFYDCCSTLGYVRRLPYWRNWSGYFPRQAIIPLAVNIVIFAAGIHVSWKKEKLVGLTPLLLASTYLLFNAVFRNSGGRYILPVDWSGAFYFSIGLAQASIFFIDYITDTNLANRLSEWQDSSQSPPREEALLHSAKFYAITMGFLLLGISIPALEKSLPELYPAERRQEMLDASVNSESISKAQSLELQTFLSQGGMALAGRALYPRYFLSNEGDPSRGRNDPLSTQPYHRLTFFLAGPYSDFVSMPLKETPAHFPNASDVIVIGCPAEKAFDSLAIARFAPSGNLEAIALRDPWPITLTCPLPSPLD
jgi:hypothetical protein